ncbi:MAG: hypothetical protein ACC608_07800 [Anaerofustis sp.]
MRSIVESNENVGAYLKKLIEKKYPSHRQFCKAYVIANGFEPDDDELRKMGNRLSQIIKGEKAIQTYDLPFFTDLLEVSCEEILSCGKFFAPISGHITNYEIAFSKDPCVWQKYIDHDDKLILNTDEYNKTIIDYAIEFKNYELIKYLMDHEYIWFVDESKYDRGDFALGFGAGTSIKRRDVSSQDYGLMSQMSPVFGEEIRLRKGVITLALENEDLDTLTTLRAKEIPAFFLLSSYVYMDISCYNYYDEDIIEQVSRSGDKVLRYFSEPYTIKDNRDNEHMFIYPFLGEIIDRLTAQKSKYAEPLLRRAIGHNQSVFDKLQSMVNEASQIAQNRYVDWEFKPQNDVIMKEALNYFWAVKKDGWFSYSYSRAKNDTPEYFSNVVMTKTSSDDLLLSSLITQLNGLFDRVLNIKPNNIKED